MLHGMSLDMLRRKVFQAVKDHFGEGHWLNDLFEFRAIVTVEKENYFYEVQYTVSAEGEISLGESRKVKMEYVAAKAQDVSAAPSEIQVIPFGAHETDKGPFVLDGEGASAVIEAFSQKMSQMAIDYEHQSLAGAEAPAAGWITGLINKGKEGVWAKVSWTERATRYLKDREYRYLSPVFLKVVATGRVVRLLGAGLTNNPAIDGMVPVVNKRDFVPLNKEDRMDELLKMICTALGLDEGTSKEKVAEYIVAMKAREVALAPAVEVLALTEGFGAEDVSTAIVAMKAPVVASEIHEALGLADGQGVSEAVGVILAMKQGSDGAADMVARLKVLEDQNATQGAEGLVAEAMKAGKITPAQKDWALGLAKENPKTFETFVASAAVVVPPGEIEVSAAAAAGGGGVTEMDRVVCSQMGLNPEDVDKKHTEIQANKTAV